MGTLKSRIWLDAKGNVNKHRCYQEAWARIKKAQKQSFYFEAVTIEESIICDRILSSLVSYGAKHIREDGNRYLSLGRLIEKWREWSQEEGWEPITEGGFDDLIGAVDAWRERRNTVVHGAVKSPPNTPGYDIEQVIGGAEATAQEGDRLARAVCRWQSRLKRSMQRSAAAPRQA